MFIKLTPKALQFDLANNLDKPWPFTNLVGFISMSNSKILAIHLLLFPSMSGWINISFTDVEGTYATTFECITYILKSLRDFTKEYVCFSTISYIISTSLNALLKKEIGCSNPSTFFVEKQQPMCQMRQRKISEIPWNSQG
jgi:hypothetical protein